MGHACELICMENTIYTLALDIAIATLLRLTSSLSME